MSVARYKLKVLKLQDFSLTFDVPAILKTLKAWRNKTVFADACETCGKKLVFEHVNFATCCNILHLNTVKEYVVRSIAVRTPKCHFLSPYLKSKLKKYNAIIDQQFLVLPDPIYWQRTSVTTYETSLKFVQFPKLKHKKTKNPKGSFHEDKPDVNNKLISIQQNIIDAPLYHCSLASRTQGKETLYRKIAIPKRAEKTARAMIVPAPHLAPNQVALPQRMVRELKVYRRWVIVNRMPSLSAESFVALFVVQAWEHDCIGLPCEVLDGLHADFDGDEVNVWPVYSCEAQLECETILDSRENMRSFKNSLKLYPSQDMLVAFYLSRPECVPAGFSLMDFFKTVYELEGSRSCFDWFDAMRKYYLDVLENQFCFSVSWQEFMRLRKFAEESGSYEEFEKILTDTDHPEGCLEIQVKSGAKGTFFHLYQLVGSVGFQKLRSKTTMQYIESSFLKGLNEREYVLHAKSGHDALIDSMIGVWKPGYNYFKLVNNSQNVIVDYEGRVLDGNQIVCDDVLEETYYEDLLSDKTFKFLYQKYFE
jgi:hypothetical protein